MLRNGCRHFCTLITQSSESLSKPSDKNIFASYISITFKHERSRIICCCFFIRHINIQPRFRVCSMCSYKWIPITVCTFVLQAISVVSAASEQYGYYQFAGVTYYKSIHLLANRQTINVLPNTRWQSHIYPFLSFAIFILNTISVTLPYVNHGFWIEPKL